jgi:hypothetical protein
MLVAAVPEEIHKPKISQVIAARLTEKITLDGLLEEKVWHNGHGVSELRQGDPMEGAEPTEQTLIHVAYDDEALYVGARLYDSAPDSIIALLGRRDAELDTDLFGIFIDPYCDKRSGFYFGLSAAGTRLDGTLYNDEMSDDSWDGVWDGKVSRDDSGWCAEMRIPFSQLRFKNDKEIKWGVNFRRDILRKNEELFLAYTPKNSSGFVSRFVDLVGIHDLKPPRHLELLPYVRGKNELDNSQKDNPFHGGNKRGLGMGVDVKYGLGHNLTLDATINPDFGQVEVDPAVVNLSDFETFYQEKRPFFIEGASIFNFSYGGSRSNWGFNWGNPDFFYSRRIGRAPQGSTPDNDYANIPEATTILGAGKITGRVGNGWNIGAIAALTGRENGSFSLNGTEFTQEVEPQATYGVLRGQKEIDNGRQGIGFISTITSRNFKDQVLENDLNAGAYTFGLDGWTFLDKDRAWVVTSFIGGSSITGSKERINDLQHSSMHYFQRPDVTHTSVDSTATSLSGFSGRILINKQKGNWIFNSAIGTITPGFNVNDLGFMFRNDVINGHVGAGYKWTEPTTYYREILLIGARFQSYDYGKNKIGDGYFALSELELNNYHDVEVRLFNIRDHIDNRATRGGPLVIEPGGTMGELSWESDSRKPVVIGVNAGYYSSPTIRDTEAFLGAEIKWKPRPNVSLSFGPEYSMEDEYSQYVDQFEDVSATATYGGRYLFAHLDYTEVSANLRLNWTFTPKLSLQLYMQPLFSHGNYDDFKELSKPRTYDYHIYTDEQITRDGNSYRVRPDPTNPANSYEFDNPDFHFKSLRGNAVVRWEYAPGSTLFFVWTQDRSNDYYYNDFAMRGSMDKLLGQPANNIFMVKLTYWWNG